MVNIHIYGYTWNLFTMSFPIQTGVIWFQVYLDPQFVFTVLTTMFFSRANVVVSFPPLNGLLFGRLSTSLSAASGALSAGARLSLPTTSRCGLLVGCLLGMMGGWDKISWHDYGFGRMFWRKGGLWYSAVGGWNPYFSRWGAIFGWVCPFSRIGLNHTGTVCFLKQLQRGSGCRLTVFQNHGRSLVVEIWAEDE